MRSCVCRGTCVEFSDFRSRVLSKATLRTRCPTLQYLPRHSHPTPLRRRRQRPSQPKRTSSGELACYDQRREPVESYEQLAEKERRAAEKLAKQEAQIIATYEAAKAKYEAAEQEKHDLESRARAASYACSSAYSEYQKAKLHWENATGTYTVCDSCRGRITPDIRTATMTVGAEGQHAKSSGASTASTAD
jgi:hypothetical protein